MNGDNQVANFVASPLSVAASYLITTAPSPANAGKTSGGGAYTNGSSVTVVAQATNKTIPYLFATWTYNGVVVSTNATYTFGARADANLVANFILPTYTVSAAVNPTTAGYVTGAGAAVWGTTNTLVATAYYGYGFANWTVGAKIVGANAVLNTVVSNNLNVVANFTATNVSHMVSVGTSPAGVAALTGAGTYANGQTAVIKAPSTVTNSPYY